MLEMIDRGYIHPLNPLKTPSLNAEPLTIPILQSRKLEPRTKTPIYACSNSPPPVRGKERLKTLTP